MNIALSCFKYLLFFFNLVVLLMGLAITIIAVWLRVDPTFFKTNANFEIPSLNSVVYVAIVVGLVMLFVAFLGCWGAFQGNRCMLLSYVIIVTILLIVQVVIAALVLKAINDPEIRGKINNFLSKETISSDKTDSNKREFLDFLQVKLKCCGIDGPGDYYDKNNNVPPSCRGEDDQYYQEGCSKKVFDTIKKYATQIGGIVLGAFFIQLIGGVMAVCLYCSDKHSASDVV